MALAVKVTIQGDEKYRRVLRKMTPRLNPQIISGAFIEMMLKVLRNAAQEQILPGGSGPPHPRKLTSRTGSLRRSLGPSFGLDKSGLPHFIEGGSSLVYAPVHELGTGRFPKRPFLAPAVDAVTPELERIMVKHWERAQR